MLCVLNGSGCVFYRPEDELARWTMGGSSSITSPPVYSLGVPTRETESGHERVCLSHISICPVMLGAGGALIEVLPAVQWAHGDDGSGTDTRWEPRAPSGGKEPHLFPLNTGTD